MAATDDPAALMEALKIGADTAWIVAAGSLVFFMQAGFALLESGMARSKNAVNVIMKNYCDMCFGALIFWLVTASCLVTIQLDGSEQIIFY